MMHVEVCSLSAHGVPPCGRLVASRASSSSRTFGCVPTVSYAMSCLSLNKAHFRKKNKGKKTREKGGPCPLFVELALAFVPPDARGPSITATAGDAARRGGRPVRSTRRWPQR